MASAQNSNATKIDDIYYILDGTNKTATVTWGVKKYESTPKYTGNITIPSVVNDGTKDYTVTAIGDHAFYECTGLTSITIPEGVTSIGESAFYACSGLTSVSLPESLESIGSLAFNDCYKIFGLKVPDGVTSIGNNAFCYIRNVIFNGNATGLNNNWGACALNGHVEGDLVYDSPLKKKFCAVNCSFTSQLVIPEGVGEIGNRAIYDCSVSSVVFPSTVTKVGSMMIRDARNLKDIYFLPITPPADGGGWAFGGLTLEHIYVLNDDAYKKWTALSDNYKNKVTSCPLADLIKIYKDLLTNKKNTSNLTDEEKSAVDGYITRIGEATEILGALKIYTEAIVYILMNDADYLTDDDVTTINNQIAAIQSDTTDMGAVATAESAAISIINTRQEKQTVIDELKAFIDDNKIANAPLDEYVKRINAATSAAEATSVVNDIKTEIDNYKIFTLGDWKYLLEEKNGEYTIVGNKLTFNDKDTYQSGYDFTVTGNLTYSRTFAATGVWQTWFVPFDVTVDKMKNAGMEVAKIAGVLMNEEEPYIAFAKMTNNDEIVKANTPYVVKADTSSVDMKLVGPDINIRKSTEKELEAQRLTVQSSFETFTFGGNYQPTNGYENQWYTLNTSGVFQKMGNFNLAPQRFWMTIDTRTDTPYYTSPSASAKQIIRMTVLGEDDPTGITSYENDNENDNENIYNLQGQKVTSIQKGQVYIMNGKKFFAR